MSTGGSITASAAVEFQRVVKRYGSTTAVDNISFTVEAGTLATVLGPSGCGKTTTLRLIAGLERVSAGRILIGGRDVTQVPASERNVSMVFQSYALFPHMTVLENVAYGPLPHRGTPSGPVKVAIRPDALLLSKNMPPTPSVPAHVTKAAYLGTHMEYTVECVLGSLFVVERTTSDPHHLGAEVWISLAATGITVVRG